MACLGAGGNDSFGIVEGMLAAGYTMETMPPICTGADGDYIQWWREARDKHGYTATGLNAEPEIGAWAVYYLTQILLDGDNEPKDWFAPSVLTTNENIDKFTDVTGERIPDAKLHLRADPRGVHADRQAAGLVAHQVCRITRHGRRCRGCTDPSSCDAGRATAHQKVAVRPAFW